MASNKAACPPPPKFFSLAVSHFLNFFLLILFFKRGLSLSLRLAAFGINFDKKFILPRKDPDCFNEFGGLKF